MRIVSVVTACLVAAILYALVIERDRVFALLADLSPRQEATETSNSPALDDPASTDAAASPAEIAEIMRVMARRSVAREVGTQVRLRGETEAARQVSVLSEANGKVVSDPLRKGAFVEEGQNLCTVDAGTSDSALTEAKARLAEAIARRPEVEARIPEAKARLAEARARLDEARINANAADRLSQDGFASRTRVANTEAAVQSAKASVVSAEAGVKAARAGLDSLQANIETAQAAVERAQTGIDRLNITSPFSGVLETDTAELGSLLQPGALCATVIELDPIKVVGFVAENEITRVKVGAMAGARFNQGPDVQARVSFLSRAADPVTRTFRVELTVPNEDMLIRDGQTAEILIQSQGVMAHVLAASSLTLNDEGTLGVRTIDADATAQFIPVTILRDSPQGVYVTGLPEEVEIITVGQEFVTDGVPVEPSFEEVTQ